jgi:hypothetical protein
LSPLRTALRALVLSVVTLLFFACGQSQNKIDFGSETHFLTDCADGCGSGSECVCGVCTRSCSADPDCTRLATGAVCATLAPRVSEGRCSAGGVPAACDLTCLADADCAALGAAFTCQDGYCRDASPPDPEPKMCALSPLAGSDVAVIGDSLIEFTSFTADLESALVSAGALADGDHVRDYASHLYSVLAGGTLGISNQWATAKSDGPVRIVVMDGGATDVLNGPCGATPPPDCPAIQAAVSGAEELLAEFAAAGVEHVVYAFYNEFDTSKTGTGVDNAVVNAGIDVMRPFIENACGRAALPCEFLDLRPTFAGHAEYFGADGIVWSDAGASASASAVSSVMIDRCVAWSD